MNSNIRCLIKACQALNIEYQILHSSENLVLIANKYIFTNWATPLLSHAEYRLLVDKEYTQTLFSSVIQMPKTKAYLTPKIDPTSTPQHHFSLYEDIISDFEKDFSYPLIIKRNAGTHGEGVFLVKNKLEAHNAINEIFDEHNKNWDFVALVQDYIKTKKEFRVVTLNGKIEVAYLKDISNATFSGNLSPLHWQGSKAVLINSQDIISKLQNFIAPIFTRLPLTFCGIDVIQDENDILWMIEINGSPGFDYFCRDNGDEKIISLYQKMLKKILDKI